MDDDISNNSQYEILPDEYPVFDMLYKVIVIGNSGNFNIIKVWVNPV